MLPVLRFLHNRMGNETSKRTAFGVLEDMLQDPCALPIFLPIDFLQTITRDFSEEQEVGRGGYGVVYKGVLRNGKAIAVKKLAEMHLEDAQFQNEVTYLIGLKHKNIVQLVGYCAESRWEATQVCGRYVMAEIRKRLLCFEYLNNQSLDKHLSAESCGLEWHRRYEIIRGICCGLNYLHTECRIIHLDLKPENILLDDNMVPKIADFGMSRLFGQQQSRIITESRGGTLGYMAPEYLNNGLISTKSDIFSLGVIIIELMTGSRVYPHGSKASFSYFIENVVSNWRNRLEKTLRYMPMDIYSQQVKTCIMSGLNCVDPDPKKRPTALDIIRMLNAVESRRTSESQISTLSSSCSAHSRNSQRDFGTILNRASTSRTAHIRSVLFSTMNGRKIGILAFEVANTIFKGSNLMKALSQQSMKHLNEGILRSEGVRRLISEDHSQLLALVELDIREALGQFYKEVARFGNYCVDPQWHDLHRCFRNLPQLTPRKNLKEAAVSNMRCLIFVAEYTSELYRECNALYELYLAWQNTGVKNVTYSSVKTQRKHVKNLRWKSFWSKMLEEVLYRLKDIMLFMDWEINNAFLRTNADQSQSVGNFRKRLGPIGLALHYANVILLINTLALASPAVVPDKTRDALYQALPRCIRMRLRECRPREKTIVAEARAEMDRILQWLVPVAEVTRLYYKNGVFGEWEMKGMEAVDVDEAHGSRQEEPQIIVSAMLGHESAKVNKIETLYYADKETTEGYILDLLRALHHLVC